MFICGMLLEQCPSMRLFVCRQLPLRTYASFKLYQDSRPTDPARLRTSPSPYLLSNWPDFHGNSYVLLFLANVAQSLRKQKVHRISRYRIATRVQDKSRRILFNQQDPSTQLSRHDAIKEQPGPLHSTALLETAWR